MRRLLYLFLERIEWFIRAMLSRGRIIWLLAHPIPALSRQKAWPATHRKTEKERQVAEGRGGRGWARSRIILPQKSLALYKSFNSLGLYTLYTLYPLFLFSGIPGQVSQIHNLLMQIIERQMRNCYQWKKMFSYLPFTLYPYFSKLRKISARRRLNPQRICVLVNLYWYLQQPYLDEE